MCVTVKTSEFMTAQVKLVVMNSNVFTVPNYSCDCACNLCDILSGTYKFCNLYMYLNTTQFPVGFFLFKKPSACLYKPTTGADHPQSVPLGLVTIFTTNSMGFTSTPDKITLYMPRYMHKHLVQIYNTKCVQNVHMYTLQTEAASVVHGVPICPMRAGSSTSS